MDVLTIAQNRFCKIFYDTGDYINSSDDQATIRKMSLPELLQQAGYWADNHHFGTDCIYERTAEAKYRRFIERFSTVIANE